MITINMKDLKVTKMTSEGWIQTSIEESAYYKSICAYHKNSKAEAREIFLAYIKDMFSYDKRPAIICEMSWSRFLDLYQVMTIEGLIQPKRNEIRIDSEMEIHDGQHRLAIWYAMGNESFKLSGFWKP